LIGTLRLALANRETFAKKEALFAMTLRNRETLSQFLQAAGNPFIYDTQDGLFTMHY
jgi:hypothetical protein